MTLVVAPPVHGAYFLALLPLLIMTLFMLLVNLEWFGLEPMKMLLEKFRELDPAGHARLSEIKGPVSIPISMREIGKSTLLWMGGISLGLGVILEFAFFAVFRTSLTLAERQARQRKFLHFLYLSCLVLGVSGTMFMINGTFGGFVIYGIVASVCFVASRIFGLLSLAIAYWDPDTYWVQPKE